jgi:hypothetical protein
MKQADIKPGRTYMNWPDTAIRTVTAIRNGIVHFKEVTRDWRLRGIGVASTVSLAGEEGGGSSPLPRGERGEPDLTRGDYHVTTFKISLPAHSRQ